MEIPNIPGLLGSLEEHIPGWYFDVQDTSFFLAREAIVATGETKVMMLWREKLFAFLWRNAARAAEYYSLPPNRVVEMGSQITM
jgi:KUP system potassium uptake protein